MNLLGRFEVRRLRRRGELLGQAAGVVLVGALLALAALAWQHGQLADQRERHAAQAKTLAQLEGHAAEVARLQQSLQALDKHRASLQALRSQQTAAGQGLLELAQHLPPGVHLTHWQQEAEVALATGLALSGEHLAALLSAWSAPGRIWAQAELASVGGPATQVDAASPLSAKAPPNALNFSIRLKRQAGAPP